MLNFNRVYLSGYAIHPAIFGYRCFDSQSQKPDRLDIGYLETQSQKPSLVRPLGAELINYFISVDIGYLSARTPTPVGYLRPSPVVVRLRSLVGMEACGRKSLATKPCTRKPLSLPSVTVRPSPAGVRHRIKCEQGSPAGVRSTKPETRHAHNDEPRSPAPLRGNAKCEQGSPAGVRTLGTKPTQSTSADPRSPEAVRGNGFQEAGIPAGVRSYRLGAENPCGRKVLRRSGASEPRSPAALRTCASKSEKCRTDRGENLQNYCYRRNIDSL